jgi:hypothetical protein
MFFVFFLQFDLFVLETHSENRKKRSAVSSSMRTRLSNAYNKTVERRAIKVLLLTRTSNCTPPTVVWLLRSRRQGHAWSVAQSDVWVAIGDYRRLEWLIWRVWPGW